MRGLEQPFPHDPIGHRDIEDVLAERGIKVTYESVRQFGDTFFIDEVFITISGRRYCLWRAVDQDGDVIDVYLQTRRDAKAAERFFRRLLRSHGKSPRRIVTDKLRSDLTSRPESASAACVASHRPSTRNDF